jgi:ABC-2 type transport system permease protein
MSADSALLSLRRAYQRRELLAGFVRRELHARFRGSALGFLWSFANPLLLLGVYWVVFGLVLHQRTADYQHPYAVYLLSGLLPWTFVASSLGAGVVSVVANGALVKKIAFPVEILPLAHVGANFVNLAIGMAVVLVITALTPPFGLSIAWLLVPLLLLCLLPLVCGLTLLGALFDVYFRDIEHLISVGLTAWFFLTPIVYPDSLLEKVPAGLTWLPFVNPLTGWMVIYHHALLDGNLPASARPLWGLVYLLALGLILTAGAYALFTRLSPRFEEEL